MAWCMHAMAQSSNLTAEQRERAAGAGAKYQAEYGQGFALVREHARFTPVGQAAFAGAAEFMATL